MKAFGALAVMLLLGSATLPAQYSRRYEVGFFGGFTKYDQSFQLADKSGGGVRFAYAFAPLVAVEVEGLFQSPQDVGSVHVEPLIGSASLVVNPFNTEPLAVVAEASKKDVESAIGAARAAFDRGPWPRMSPAERAGFMRRMHAALLARADRIKALQIVEAGATRALAETMMFASPMKIVETAPTLIGAIAQPPHANSRP